MPERLCKVPHTYAGRQIEVGQRFEVDPADVELMLAMGRIEREDGDKVPAHVNARDAATWPNTYTTRDMSAARPARRGRGARA